MRTHLLATIAIAAVASGCTGQIGDPPAGEGPGGHTQKFAAASATVYRLTQAQLVATYADVLGQPLVMPTELPQDDLKYGFKSIASASATVSSVDAEKYEAASYAVVDQVFADQARRDALVGCDPTTAFESCARSFLTNLASRAWRRPVSTEEIDSLVDVASGVSTDLGDPFQGLRFAAAAVFQSPSFVFRIEVGEPTPGIEGLARYTSWEMASRLSYVILDAPPDDELRAMAENDELTDSEAIREAARRLLDDPRARPTLVRFFADFMQITNLDAIKRDPGLYPAFTPTLGKSMRIEMERMFENIAFEEEGDLRGLFTTRETYVNEDLAAIYGIDGISGSSFRPYTFADDAPRTGILTSAGFLAMNAHETKTSPTHRGRWVRVNLLCDDIPPPPAGVDTTIPDPPAGQKSTLRERLEQHRTDPKCKSCHQQMDPIGFAFEHYGPLGEWRDKDELGLDLDVTTDIDGEPVEGAIEASHYVATLPAVGACMARRFYEHANGHLASSYEEPAVENLVQAFVKSDYNFKELVVELVTNEGFRYAATPVIADEEAGQ